MNNAVRRRAAGGLLLSGVLGIAGCALLDGGGDALAPPGAAPAPAAPTPFPPEVAPFDRAGRLPLVLDHLTYLEGQDGLFPGRRLVLLPVAPWVSDPHFKGTAQQWKLEVDGSLPLSLLAQAEPSGTLDAGRTRVSLDGASLGDLAAHVLRGVDALSDGARASFAVLHLVLPPLSAGQHRIEVQTPGRTQRYELTVSAPASLAPGLFRDPGGELFALQGPARRQVPDAQTLGALGFAPADAVASASPALGMLSAAPPVPRLREGAVVRAAPGAGGGGPVFRLQGGLREWLPDAKPAGPWPWSERTLEVDPVVLQTVPPRLREGMLLRGGPPDVYHVDRGALRKVPPGGDWLRDNGLDAANILIVPDRVIAALPQTSPHWRTPGGTFFDRVFDSAILGRPMPYRVYLPPEYDLPANAGRRYPVLYLLHGNGGRWDEWSGYGLEEVADQLIADGKFGRVIVVMPQGGRSYWINQEGGLRWADYVVQDLLAHVDATYRTIPRREARAIGGLSMGGHGALQLTFNHPTVFGIAGAHSPSLPTRDNAQPMFGGASGFAQRDPFGLIRVGPAPPAPPRVWIDIGEGDRWRRDAEAVHRALDERGWAHDWHLYPGSHDGSYWGDHLWEYLPFYAAAFAGNGIAL